MWQGSLHATLLNCLQCDTRKRATTPWGSCLSVGQGQASPFSPCLSSGGVQSRPGAFGCTVWAADREKAGRNAQQTHDNGEKINYLPGRFFLQSCILNVLVALSCLKCWSKTRQKSYIFGTTRPCGLDERSVERGALCLICTHEPSVNGASPQLVTRSMHPQRYGP